MKIMVSACLLGENCKYNGGNNRNDALLALLAGHEVIPVCPEVLGGLPTPRVPAEIAGGKVVNREGVSVMMVTHSEKVACCSERVIFLVDGNIQGELILGKLGSEDDIPVRERKLRNWLSEREW